ncbi:MAG TPA: PQQ-binding-like beta-propeller repeat protein [Gaiellaceae bacterium]|nr:PQQ-binding-like beta-propeller repeat protein [Gaiellaceae bacterium]
MLIAVLAGCGGGAVHHAAVAQPRRHLATLRPAKLVVTVVDGDRSTLVRGATVRLWHRTARTNRLGEAVIRVPDRKSMYVTVAADGFGTRTLFEPFAAHRLVAVRIYRSNLQWPMYGATFSRAQSQVHIHLHPPFKTVWFVPLGGLVEFPAVVDNGVAYVGNRSGVVFAIAMRNGDVLWRHRTNAVMASSLAIDGTELVHHSMDGRVSLLDRANGSVRWSYDVGSPIESSPIVRQGIDYFGTWDGRLVALDLRTHRLRWTRDLGAKITSSASIAGGTLYVGDYAGRLWALSAETGATRWTASVNGRIYGTPAVAHGRVFVPSSTGDSLTAFSTHGRYLWRISTGSYVYSSPAVWGGRVFFGGYNGVFYGVSAASGRVLWEVGAGGPISGAAVVVDGVAYAGSFAHRIVGVDAKSGHVVLNFHHGHYVPVSGDGMRLLFHGYSSLYAVEPVRSLR